MSGGGEEDEIKALDINNDDALEMERATATEKPKKRRKHNRKKDLTGVRRQGIAAWKQKEKIKEGQPG